VRFFWGAVAKPVLVFRALAKMLIIGDTTLWFALWVIKQDARVFGDNLFFVAYTIQLAIKPAKAYST
jgi:hypothetical protein